MRRSLRDPELVEAYRRQRRSGGLAPPVALVRLLEWLQTLELPGDVYAVTSMGELSLTTAPGHGEAERDHLWVNVSGWGYGVWYFEAGNRHSVAGRRCKEEELPHVVEAYLLRLLLQQ